MWEELKNLICKLRFEMETCCAKMKDFLTVKDLANPNNGIEKLYVNGQEITHGGGGPSGIAGKYISLYAGSGLTVPTTHGGIVKGTSVDALSGKPMSVIIDSILFPTIAASIKTHPSLTISSNVAHGSFEIGESKALIVSSVFNRGLIKNGDGSNGPKLIGAADKFKLFVKGVMVLENNNGMNMANVMVIGSGSNKVKVRVEHLVGDGVYKDSKGDPATNLDSHRNAGTIDSSEITYVGVHAMFLGQDLPSSSSAEIRAMGKVLLHSGDKMPAYSYKILTSTAHSITIAIPSTATLHSVLLVESSNANVTGTFHKGADVDVSLPDGSVETYSVYVATVTSPYAKAVHYKIKIT